MIGNYNVEDLIYYKNEKNLNKKSVLGIEDNIIVEIPNFISRDIAKSMIEYFEYQAEKWGPIAFYGSSGMGFADVDHNMSKFNLPEDLFLALRESFKNSIESVFGRKVVANTSHAQKWDVGAYASPHSDNSNMDGLPNSFQINKYVGILYLNDDYEGGELYFPEHNISFKPSPYSFICFPGGVENIHGVSEIESGCRYTMVSFWDYADAEYSDELKLQWEEELKIVRIEQEKQRLEWAGGNKYA